MTDSRYRVIQWATGNAGALTLKGILDHPGLELVGLWVHSDGKVGKDAGELAGTGTVTGVRATNDVQEILDLDADCVCYLTTDMGRAPEEVVDEVCRLLASGKSVVGPQYQLAAPWGLWAGYVDRIEAACASGGSTLYGAGLQPDGHPAVAMAAASMCMTVRSISVGELHNVESYDEPTGAFFGALGFGSPGDAAPDPGLTEMFNNHMMRPVVDLLARGLGATIDRYEHRREYAVTDTAIELPHGKVDAGQVSAVHNRIDAIADGLTISCHQYYWLGDYPTGWPPNDGHGGYILDISGNPDLSMHYAFELPDGDSVASSLLATAARIVNAIPSVCRAEPGIKTLYDLPVMTLSTGSAPPKRSHESRRDEQRNSFRW